MLVIITKPKFFLLMGILIQNFNNVDLVKFLEKNKDLHIQIVTVTLNMISCRTARKEKKKVKKGKNPRLHGQNKFFS
jgi:hypothetical protein